jgi:hypothetical protein
MDDDASTGEVRPKLCDLCGMAISDGSELYAFARDSSPIHPYDPKFNGNRCLTACSAEHMTQLQEEYKHRPFIEEEPWAGKMGRVFDQHPEGLSIKDMIEATGLTRKQLDRAIAWNNEQVRHHRRNN